MIVDGMIELKLLHRCAGQYAGSPHLPGKGGWCKRDGPFLLIIFLLEYSPELGLFETILDPMFILFAVAGVSIPSMTAYMAFVTHQIGCS